jgi:hypothetical protein
MILFRRLLLGFVAPRRRYGAWPEQNLGPWTLIADRRQVSF